MSSSLGICLGNCIFAAQTCHSAHPSFQLLLMTPVPLSTLSQARQTPSLRRPNKPKWWTLSPLFGVHAEEGAGLQDRSSQLPCVVPGGGTGMDTNITDFPTPSCGVPSRLRTGLGTAASQPVATVVTKVFWSLHGRSLGVSTGQQGPGASCLP